MTTETDGLPAPSSLQTTGGRSDKGKKKIEKIDELDLHGEDVQEILGVPPRWAVRWGSTVALGVVAMLIGLTWILHYPDVVPASIVITTPTPPSSVTAQASGDLTDIRVRDHTSVNRGDLLAVIESSADPSAVFALGERLATLDGNPEKSALTLEFADELPIGELRGDYAAFVRSFKALKFYLVKDPANTEIRNLEPQIARHGERRAFHVQQRDLLAEQVTIAEDDYARASLLVSHKTGTVTDMNARARQLLQVKESLQGAALAIADTDLEVDKLQQSIAALRLRDQQQRHELLLAFGQSYETLRSRLAIWERSYVLRAPIDGQVSLFKYWSNHQFVKSGDEVLTIVPTGSQTPLGKMMVPVANSGKIKLGQSVFIRLDNYQYEEYGLLRGVVQSIAPVPRGAQYAIEVALPDGLTTSFGKHLDFRQEMQGGAEIVTEDLRLIERIFYQLRGLFVVSGTNGGEAETATAK
jgi:multidrug resistance efflux pump